MPLDGNEAEYETKTDQLTEVQKVLLKAAGLIEKHGHCKFDQQDEYGRLCIHGAIAVAAGCGIYRDNELSEQAWRRVAAYLGDVPGVSRTGIAWWNNAEGRTQSEVVTALRAAAGKG